MSAAKKIVFRLNDVPYIESPDNMMRNRVMVTEDTCGSQQYSAGIFYVRPGSRGHADKHVGQEELYYITEGRGIVVIDDEPHPIEAGDVVFIPDGSEHYLINESDETLGLFWAIAKPWNGLPEIQEELAKWHEVEEGSDWQHG